MPGAAMEEVQVLPGYSINARIPISQLISIERLDEKALELPAQGLSQTDDALAESDLTRVIVFEYPAHPSAHGVPSVDWLVDSGNINIRMYF